MTLVAVQMALAFVLVAATSLAMRAVGDLRGRDVGVNPAGLLSAEVYLPREPYVTRNISGTGGTEIAAFNPAGPALYDRIRAALQTTPGVVEVAGAGARPFSANPFVQFYPGTPNTRPTIKSRGSTWPSPRTTSRRWGFASFVGGTSRPLISPTRPGWCS